MNFTQILSITLSIVIHTFSIIIIGVFLLELQAAWNAHTPSTPTAVPTTPTFTPISHRIDASSMPIVQPVTIPVHEPVIKIVKEATSVSMSKKSKSKLEVDSLREKCSKAGIEWRFAQTNTTTNRKRHLTAEEMIRALS